MKTSFIIFMVTCGVVAGALVYLNRQKTQATAAPIAGTLSNQTTADKTQPHEDVTQKPEASQPVSKNAVEPAPMPAATAAATETVSNHPESPLAKTVSALLSAGQQKQALLDQLRTNGQLDAVIAELQQRAAANPNDPEIPTTLGEALLSKLRSVKDTSGDYNEMGILAMQADQDFNAALKIDPQNWEAQFVKYATMYYWPASAQMDSQVVQHLSSLIDQQESMTPQLDFAQTYLVLGNEYEKIGKEAEAQATWALGAQKFPGDQALQNKIAGASR